MGNLIAFGLFVGSGVLVCWMATYGKSIWARDQFIIEVSVIRDELEDDVFFGRLPDVECVSYWYDKAERLLMHVEAISFSAFAAFSRIAGSFEADKEPHRLDLTNSEVQRLDHYEERLVDALARYIEGGSRLWFLFPLARALGSRSPSKKSLAVEQPRELAATVSRTLDNPKVPFGGELLVHG
jgi:hypothetical protein